MRRLGRRRGLVDTPASDGVATLGKWVRYTPQDVANPISLDDLLRTSQKKAGRKKKQKKPRKTRSRSTFA